MADLLRREQYFDRNRNFLCREIDHKIQMASEKMPMSLYLKVRQNIWISALKNSAENLTVKRTKSKVNVIKVGQHITNQITLIHF